MAQPTLGNSFTASPTPALNNPWTNTGGVVQSAGSNRWMVLFATYYAPNTTVAITSITYGGNTITPMSFTNIHSTRRGGLQQRMEMWELANAPAGLTSEDLSITWNQNINSPVSLHVRTFTDCSGYGAYIRNGASNTPNTKNIVLTGTDSTVMMTSCSINAFNSSNGQQIPTGSNRSFTSHNTNRQVATGAVRTGLASPGSMSLRANVVWGTVSLDAIEILGVTVTPTITTSVTTLSGMTYPLGSGPSNTVTFTADLVPADVITLTPSSNFSVSLDGVSFTSSPSTLNVPSSSLPNATIYVRMNAGVGLGMATGSLFLSATGATTKVVTLQGTVTTPSVRRIFNVT